MSVFLTGPARKARLRSFLAFREIPSAQMDTDQRRGCSSLPSRSVALAFLKQVLGTGFGGSVFLATSRRPDRQGRTSRFVPWISLQGSCGSGSAWAFGLGCLVFVLKALRRR